jgi:hypothetical protein
MSRAGFRRQVREWLRDEREARRRARGVVPPQHRLRALRKLRKLLGREAYRKGKMPLGPAWLQ